ncbi:MAG: hypothetical protein IJW29_09340 [Clostridia bacterium]|nr:hypothetical protein [Clostridia bacterium]MBQ9785694.1 hypothetical protein [Clostridia bacterium]
MKNRRNVIIAFMLCAVLCLGIGFAALSDDLAIDGTLAYDKEAAEDVFNAEVYFTGAEADASSTCNDATQVTYSVEAADNGDANDLLKIAVGDTAFAVANETVVIKATVKNDSTDAVTVALTSTTAPTSGAFEVSCTGATIDAGSTGTVTVTIKLLSTEADVSDTFAFALTATSAN